MNLKNFDPDHFFRRQTWPSVLAIGSGLTVLLGVLDYFTGAELSLSVFYLSPILFVTWYAGYRYGILISAASIAIWVAADFLIGRTYSHPFILGWNILVRLSFFLIATNLLTQVKSRLEREQKLALTDSLTQAANHRYFYHISDLEIARARRNGLPFTVAYLDLDDFKSINDQFGHQTGDRLLGALVSVLKKNLRRTDIIARLGGDEFTILFPETDDEEASVLLKKLGPLIQSELEKIQPVSCSIGAVTYLRPPTSVDEMLMDVDRLMYLAKRNGKGRHFHEIAFNPGKVDKQKPD